MTAQHPPKGPVAAKPLPPQVTMGLLPYLTAHALDEDYEHVAAQRRTPEHGPARRPPIGTLGACVIAAFALLVIVAGAQTSRNAVSGDRERRSLIGQVTERKAALDVDRGRLEKLRVDTGRLESTLLNSETLSANVLNQINQLSLHTGAIPARGQGVKVTVDDAPGAKEDPRLRILDTDLQKLANGLWQAGAEAISINGQRLTNLTSIRTAGEAITVGFISLRAPYTVLAIGNKNTLPARFANTSSGQAWLDLQSKVHLKFNMVAQNTMTLPAARNLTLVNATRPDSKTVSGTGSGTGGEK